MKIKNKYIFLFLLLLVCAALFAEERTGTVGGSSAHVNVQFNKVVDEQYTLRALPSGVWHFTEDFSFPGGNGWFRTETYGITSEINIGTNTAFVDAASIFSATIAGKMFTSGEESGELVPWSVTGKYSGGAATASIYPNSIFLPFGLSYNFEYRINGLIAPGGFWRYGENGISGGWMNKGATFAFPTDDQDNAPGVYVVSAARNTDGELRADANVTVVAISKLSGGGVTSTTDSPGEAETLYLAKGGSAVTLTAEKNPTAATAWPNGFPKWSRSKDGGAFAAITADKQGNYSFTPSDVGSYVVKAECGDGYGKAMKITVIDINVPAAIRRKNPDTSWSYNTVSINAPAGVVLKLTLSRTSGQKGAVEHLSAKDNSKTMGTERTVTAPGGAFELYLKGVEESDSAKNLSLTVTTGTGKPITEKKFIVYSGFLLSWTPPDYLQHKDTAENCSKCPVAPGNSAAHSVGGVHPNDRQSCEHCSEYCARACLKAMKGGNQDDYRVYKMLSTSSMEDNHGIQLSLARTSDYMYENSSTFTAIAKYDDVLNYFYNQNRVQIAVRGGTDGHAYILLGCGKNNVNGDISVEQTYVWDPLDGSKKWKSRNEINFLLTDANNIK